MFQLLTQVLLWILIGGFAWFIFGRLVPQVSYTILGAIAMVAILALAFYAPNTGAIAEVWSLLSFPLRPLGLVITLLIAAAWRIRGGLKQPTPAFIWAALLILILASLPAVSYFLTQQIEVSAIAADAQRRSLCRDACPSPNTPETADVIVLLGRGTTQPAVPYRSRIQLTATGDRVLTALQSYREQIALGREPYLIISAPAREDLSGSAPEISEARTIQLFLYDFGVPATRMILDEKGSDVHSSAVAVGQLLRSQGLSRRIILVTSALEINRAVLAFAKEGVSVIPRATNFLTYQSGAKPQRRLRFFDLLPNADALAQTTHVIEEYLVSIYYFLRGWLAPFGF